MTPQNEMLTDEIKISAPVRIPSLTIDLVPADLVYRLEEYRSDQIRWEAVFWTFVGATFGVIVNWVTTDPITITKSSIILVVILGVMIIITGLSAREYKKRADMLKASAFSANKPETKESSVPEKITVGIIDLLNGKTVTAELPTNAVISRLLPALIKKMELPSGAQYEILHKDTGKIIKPSETLQSFKVANGDTLSLIPSLPTVSVLRSNSINQESDQVEKEESKKVKVTISDMNGAKTVTAELPTDAPVSALINALVIKMNLPKESEYSLMRKFSGKILDGNISLGEAGVNDGESLRLIPQIKE